MEKLLGATGIGASGVGALSVYWCPQVTAGVRNRKSQIENRKWALQFRLRFVFARGGWASRPTEPVFRRLLPQIVPPDCIGVPFNISGWLRFNCFFIFLLGFTRIYSDLLGVTRDGDFEFLILDCAF